MPKKGSYSGVSPDTHNPDGSELKWYQTTKGWICMGSSCLLVIILIIVLIVREISQYIEETNDQNIVKSPMVGVAYLSADPNTPAYVKVGQHVKAGDTLLLIEAMKTFNEIKAPKSGVIKKILALNSQPVEY